MPQNEPSEYSIENQKIIDEYLRRYEKYISEYEEYSKEIKALNKTLFDAQIDSLFTFLNFLDLASLFKNGVKAVLKDPEALYGLLKSVMEGTYTNFLNSNSKVKEAYERLEDAYEELRYSYDDYQESYERLCENNSNQKQKDMNILEERGTLPINIENNVSPIIA